MPEPSTMPSPVFPEKTQYIGLPMDRADGRAKVTGAAKYAAEFSPPGLVHAVAFCSTIAKGIVIQIDSTEAEKLPGILAVITRKNAGIVLDVDRRPKPPQEGQPGQTMAMLQDDFVHYDGQYLGMVVAENLEQAAHAADLIKITYAPQTPTLEPEKPIELLPLGKRSRGNAKAALSKAAVKIEQTYATPVEHHNPMEMHATVAAWDGDKLTLYDSTQHVRGSRRVTAAALDIPVENIRVIDPFVGGGFGCKGSVWPNTYLAALAARYVGRPVKLMLTRKQMFSQAGYRPQTIQKISLGADRDGKLISISHDNTSQTSDFDEWVESSTRQSLFVYSCPNVQTSQAIARVNFNTPTQMRAPGMVTGVYALESAMDELAYALKMDPIELRLKNYSTKNEDEKKPYSSKSLRECYHAGAQRFGWSQRNPQPRSMRDGDNLIGWGMATAVYPAGTGSSSASVRYLPDGSAIVTVAAHDLGTGTYTILAQIAAEVLGINPIRIRVELGDTVLPSSPGAGGSRTACTAGSAVKAAAENLIRNIAHYAINDSHSPLFGKLVENISAKDGQLILKDELTTSESLAKVFSRNGARPISAAADTQGTPFDAPFSGYSWGAQFAEVRVNPHLGTVRVSRFVGAFAAGRILNAKTGRSQILGAIVMGIGMGLLEQSIHDPQRGNFVTNNLADYLLPVNADIPAIECIFVDERDELINPLGAKGIGELGITGVAAAITNAVYHATGKRIRDLPVTLEKIMDV